ATIFADKVQTKQLCISDASGNPYCIDRATLDAYIASTPSLQAQPAPQPVVNTTPTLTSTPTPDQQPVVDTPVPVVDTSITTTQ
ncbi:MAG: hypothetical protein WCQ32_03920, partial [bacterium]